MFFFINIIGTKFYSKSFFNAMFYLCIQIKNDNNTLSCPRSNCIGIRGDFFFVIYIEEVRKYVGTGNFFKWNLKIKLISFGLMYNSFVLLSITIINIKYEIKIIVFDRSILLNNFKLFMRWTDKTSKYL